MSSCEMHLSHPWPDDSQSKHLGKILGAISQDQTPCSSEHDSKSV